MQARQLTPILVLILSLALACVAAAGMMFSALSQGHLFVDGFEVEIVTSQSYGVVPFEVILSVEITSGSDEITGVSWDFESDGTTDAMGTPVSHVFDQPIDYEVTAEIITELHGTLLRTATVSGHTALMTITFDDGPVTIYSYGFPLLESKGIKATAYVVIDWVRGGWYLDWDEIQELYEAGWDIGSHTMTHARLTSVDDSTLHYELCQSQIELETRGFQADHFSVPYCAWNDHVIDAIMQYYQSNRICGGLNPRVEEVDPYRMLSCMSDSGKAFGYYKAHIDSAVATRGWYMLTNHSVQPICFTLKWCITTDLLGQIIDYALAGRVKIVTIEEALKNGGRPTAGVPTVPDDCRPIRILSADQRIYASQGSATVHYMVLSPVSLDICIYDTLGRRVRRIRSELALPGEHAAVWNGMNDRGSPVPCGAYFCGFISGTRIMDSARILVLR
jgi:peptidoglycan/xylan/chitin deacetylase (PgdA/CDA1 family)